MNRHRGNGALVVIALWVSLGLVSCHPVYTPKPRGYFKIDFPQKDYRVFNEKGYPYSFEYPDYAEIIKDTSFFNKRPENPWWININFPQFHGKIYLSYKIIGPEYSLEKLVNDAYTMTYKNTVKADAIIPEIFQTPNRVTGMFYNVSGNAATARQFYATDSVRHFLRGALYFYAVPNADSLKPVIEFVEKDMWHMLETLKWKPAQGDRP